MPDDKEIIIRKYNKNDRDSVRKISYETAFLGDSADIFFDDEEVLSDALTMYFTDFEPESSFVAETQGKVVGYVIGAKSVEVMNKITGRKIMPRLILKILLRMTIFKPKVFRFLGNSLKSLMKREFGMPDFSCDYPAIMHINIHKEFRGRGIGVNLVDSYLNFLRENKIIGVHFGTISEQGKEFFVKYGFEKLFSSKRTYFNYLGKNVDFNIFGKKLG